MGGDPSRVWVQSADDSLSLERDVEGLFAIVREKGAVLVVIDPLTAYLGNVDWRSDPDVRRVLSPLIRTAPQAGAAILGVMHLNKDEERRALYRAGGSVAFVAGARIVLAVVPNLDDADREQRVLVSAKSNLGPPPLGLAYRIMADGPTPQVAWEGEVDVDVEAIFRGVQQAMRPAPRTTEAKTLLSTLLSDGPKPIVEIREATKAKGIKWPTLERAKRELAVTTSPRAGGGWLWSLPVVSSASPVDDEGFHHQEGNPGVSDA